MNNEDKILSILGIIVDKVDKLEQGQAKLEQGQAKLEQEVSEIKFDVTETKNRIIIMEENNSTNFKLLHDGYKSSHDAIKEIRKDVSEIKNRLENQDTHIKLLESERKAAVK